MKSILPLTILVIVLFAYNANGQEKTISKKGLFSCKKKPREANYTYQCNNCSPFTSQLLAEYKTAKSISQKAAKKYLLYKVDDKYFVGAIVKIKNEEALGEMKNLGVEIQTNTKNIITCRIPVEQLEEVTKINSIEYVEISEQAHSQLDNARSASGIDLVHQGYQLPISYHGEGVVVGIIDKGFDYTHSTFYDASGANYRVKKVWEQESGGTPPSGYSYGNELIGTASILSDQTSSTTESHATHVSGIAAGSGYGTSGQYEGVASASDLIFVASDFTTLGIMNGINYIFDYANSVSKPCVINMSIGSDAGAHDGTSWFDQYCDVMVGPGKVLVGSAGNSGGDTIHVLKTFSSQDTVLTFMAFPYTSLKTNGKAVFDLWGSAGTSFSVAANIYNVNSNSWEDWTPYISSTTNNVYSYTLQDDDIFSDDCYVTITTQASASQNNKPHISIEVDNTDQDDNYKYVLIEILGANTTINGWAVHLPDACYLRANGYSYPVVGGNTNSTVCEVGGVGNGIITVGAYTTKNSYTDISGYVHSIDFPASIGAIAPFSSKGPTADYRTKPDITAPGNVITSSVNRFDGTFSSSDVVVSSGGNKFGIMQGTSMSSPLVTGIVALMLQGNPSLSASQIKQLLKDNATTDSWTGTISSSGSYTWGWGKVNAHQCLTQLIGIDEYNFSSSIDLYPNPSNGKFRITEDNNVLPLHLTVNNSIGDLVYASDINNNGTEIDLSNQSNGVYFVKINSEKGSVTKKFVLNK